MSEQGSQHEQWINVERNSSDDTRDETPCTESESSSPTATYFSNDDAASSSSDREIPKDPTRGWPRLAHLMADTPDFASFPTFRDLNIKSLMYYQVELTNLRKELHEAEWKDARHGDSTINKYAKRADWLLESRDEESHSQWDIIKKIRICLKDYNEALIQFSQVSALPTPDGQNVETLRRWLIKSDGGSYMIAGDGTEHWGPVNVASPADLPRELPLGKHFVEVVSNLIWPHQPKVKSRDLVTMVPPVKADGFTKWIAHDFVPFHHSLKTRIKSKIDKWKSESGNEPEIIAPTATPPAKRSIHSRIVKIIPDSWFSKEITKDSTWDEVKENTLDSYSNKAIMRFSAAAATILACLLPIVAITVLSGITEKRDMLLVMAGFTAIFAAGLMFVTDGSVRRVDIFTATAAFAAVMVVFVQGQVQQDHEKP